MPEGGGKDDLDRPKEGNSSDTLREKQTANLFFPSTDLYFAFGPKQSYFIRSRGIWRYSGSEAHAKSIDDIGKSAPLIAAFKHNGGYFLGGERGDGMQFVACTQCDENLLIRAGDAEAWVKSREAYQRLYDWLLKADCKTERADLHQASLTIGPDGSYFARWGTSYFHHRLPSDLSEQITTAEKEDKSPSHVALGASGAWVTLWSDGTRSWNLSDRYPLLASNADLQDQDRGRPTVVFIALDAYQPGKFFLVDRDGYATYSVQMQSTEDTDYIDEVKFDYLQQRAREDGSSFKGIYTTRNGVSSDYAIDKSTAYDFGSGNIWHPSWYNVKVGKLDTAQIVRRLPPVRREHAYVIGATGLSSFTVSRCLGLSPLRSGVIGCAAALGAFAGQQPWIGRAKL